METEGPNQHSAKLTILIQNLLTTANIDFTNLVAVGISTGPGSYTGLRVGMAAAKAICMVHNLPLIGISSLESIACGIRSTVGTVLETDLFIPMIDARRMEVYTAAYNRCMEPIAKEAPMVLDQSSFQEDRFRAGALYFGGNGSHKFKEVIEHTNARFIDVKSNAEDQVELIRRRWREKSFLNLEHSSPNYIKSPNITSPKR